MTDKKPFDARSLSHLDKNLRGLVDEHDDDGAQELKCTLPAALPSGTFSYRPFFDCSSFIGDWDQTAPTAAKKTVFGSRLP